MLDAHNCYPYKGQYADRIVRALSTGFPVAIEQDLALSATGRVVVSHTTKVTGDEPALEQHFFERVRPIIEKALRENDRSRWPLIVLHFDFKSNDIPLIEAVWAVLGKHLNWITTAEKTSDPHRLSPFDPKPLLVLTEDNDNQEEVFFTRVPVGARLRVFGSAHTAPNPGRTTAEKNHFLATTPAAELLTQKPTNYRRWWNNSWFPVEEAGQPNAGPWTEQSEQRLRALVDHAHHMGYWIRFYTLDGFARADDQGWGGAYNFGPKAAVEARWRAAINAGVDLIATDQYEALRAFLNVPQPAPLRPAIR
ncbi:MAG: hypothetical protein JO022_01110 [Acidobacteriaceae bacterium]|nr:hypothetical protein [Acidobacteriaceae bacterium]